MNEIPLQALYILIGLATANALDRVGAFPRNGSVRGELLYFALYMFAVTAWPYCWAYNLILLMNRHMK